jgi:hypothetical protein
LLKGLSDMLCDSLDYPLLDACNNFEEWPLSPFLFDIASHSDRVSL